MSYRHSYYNDYYDRDPYIDRNRRYRYDSPAYYDYNDYGSSFNYAKNPGPAPSPPKISERQSGSWDIRDMFIAPSGGHSQKCCPHVVDPLGFLAFLAAIPIATFFLNNQIVMFLGKKKKKRRNFGVVLTDSTVATTARINGTETTPAFGEVLISVLDEAIEVFQGKLNVILMSIKQIRIIKCVTYTNH